MTLTTESLRAWLAQPNVVAFLAAIELGEIPAKYRGTPDAYRVLYGGTLIDDLGRHPNVKVTAGGYTSTAAGRFMALYGTWSDFCKFLGETPETVPFDAERQDLFGVWCLQRRHALQDIVAGKIEAAISKCNKEWSSMPGSPYGQPTVTLDQFLAAYTGAGGTIDNGELLQPAAPIEDRPQPPAQPEPQKEWTMPIPAIVLGLIQAAASVLPVIAQIKGDKSQSAATQNVAIAGKVLDVVATTVGAVNQQQAVEIVQQDPAARQKADEALRAQFFDLLKFAQEQEAISWDRTEKSVSEARSFAERMTSGEGWRAIGYGALLGLLALLIIGGGGVIFAYVLFAPKDLFDGSVRAGIIEIVKAIVILVVGFFFGSSSSSRQSGEALRNIAQGKGTQV